MAAMEALPTALRGPRGPAHSPPRSAASSPGAPSPACAPRPVLQALQAELQALPFAPHPIAALTLLRSCGISPPAPSLGLDAVRCYQPWCGQGGLLGNACRSSDGVLADLNDGAASPLLSGRLTSAHTTALCSPCGPCGPGRGEKTYSPLSVQLPLPLTVPLAGAPRRPRSEKRPTPEDQKDQRYLERRRRNNRAAKKSRDARRAREDQVALRAALLEHENAVLRAQVMTLREETNSLRQLLVRTKEVQLQGL